MEVRGTEAYRGTVVRHVAMRIESMRSRHAGGTVRQEKKERGRRC